MAGVRPAERGLRPVGHDQTDGVGAGARPDQAATGRNDSRPPDLNEISPPHLTVTEFLNPLQMLSDRKCQELLQKLDKAQRGNYKLASTLEKIRHVVD